MKAVHRVAGNFPSRGYGVSLSSPGFSSVSRIVSGSNARLPLNDTGIGRVRESTVQVVEAYHAIELHPLTYGSLATFRSATVAIKGARACSYTDIALPAGEDVPSLASTGGMTEHLLRFNGFMPVEEFWSLDKNITTLRVGEWTEADASVLALPHPVPMSEQFHHSLLIHYWRCATLQAFGPWNSAEHDGLLYVSDPVLAAMCARPKNITLCLGNEPGCDEITSLARAFLWQELLLKLPRAVQNIASMAAAVPLQYTASMYADAALCVVYPSGQGKLCFHPEVKDCFLDIRPEEESMITQVLQERRMPWMDQMARAFCRIADKPAEQAEHCEVMADYDLCLAMWKITYAGEGPLELLKDWYALRNHLQHRHHLKPCEIDQVLADIEPQLAARLSADDGSILAGELSGEDPTYVKRTLLAFLWERTLHCPSLLERQLAQLMKVCQKPATAAFFTTFPEDQVYEGEDAARVYARKAGLMDAILRTYYENTRPSDKLTGELLQHAALYQQCPPVNDVMQRYLRELISLHPDWRAGLLPLSSVYLPSDEAVAGVIRHMQQLDQLPPAEDLRFLRDYFCPECLTQLNDYGLDLLQRCLAQKDLTPAVQLMAAVGQDVSDAIRRFLGQPASIPLSVPLFQQLLGGSLRYQPKDVLPAVCQHIEAGLALPVALTDDIVQRFRWAGMVRDVALQDARRIRALPDVQDAFRTSHHTAVTDWLLKTYRYQPALPEETAVFPWLKSILPAQAMDVLQLYDTLLKYRVTGVAKQVDELLADPNVLALPQPMEGIPNILEHARRLLLDRLTQAWQSGGLIKGLTQHQALINFTSLSAAHLDDAAMNAAACSIRSSCGQLADPRAWILYAGQYDGLIGKLSELLPRDTARLTALYGQTVYASLSNALPMLLERLENLAEAEKLHSFRCRLGTGSQPGDDLPAMLSRLNWMHEHPKDLDLQEAYACIPTLLLNPAMSENVCAACRRTYRKPDGACSFPVQVWQALMHAIHPQRIDWKAFLAALEPQAEKMCAKPVAQDSLPLLGVISASLAVLAEHDNGANLCLSFADWLNRTDACAAYTASIRKHRNRFFISGCTSPSLRMWLGEQQNERSVAHDTF